MTTLNIREKWGQSPFIPKIEVETACG